MSWGVAMVDINEVRNPCIIKMQLGSVVLTHLLVVSGYKEMEQLSLDDFRHGGLNITGFRLLRPDSPRLQAVRKEYRNRNSTIMVRARGTLMAA